MVGMILHHACACLRRLIRAREGNSMIEFAAISPLLIALMIGTTDYGMQMYTSTSLESSARAGAQMVLLDPNDMGGITTAAKGASAIDPAKLNVNVTKQCNCPDGTAVDCGGTCAVGSLEVIYTVDVNTVYSNLFPYPGVPDPVTLVGRAQVRTK